MENKKSSGFLQKKVDKFSGLLYIRSRKGGQKMKIVIIVEGGVVQEVLTEDKVEVLIVDYDVDGVDDNELTSINQGDGTLVSADIYTIQTTKRKSRVTYFFNLLARRNK